MFKDMYNTFDHECIPYNYPFSFQCGDKTEYMVGNVPTYEMDYGDTTVFPFFIDKQFSDLDILITIYNYRREVVHEVLTSPNSDSIVYLEINSDLSAKLVKGNYYIRLQARDKRLYGTNSNIGELLPYNCTLISSDDCSLYIK